MTNAFGISPGSPHSRAFSASNRNAELWYLSPSKVHMSARVTGGLAQMYRDVKSEIKPEVETGDEHVDENSLPVFGTELLAKRYEYVKTLGEGRTAVVIQAKDTFMNNKSVAIKIFHASNFLVGGEEADAHRQLQRSDPEGSMPILKLLNTFRLSAHYCLTLECCDPLAVHLRFKTWNLSGEKSLAAIKIVARNLFRALHFLHSLNIIHADVKPDNLLVTKDELNEDGVRLIDFGNCIRSSGELEFYKEDYDLQTLNYRAPEVIVGKSIDPSIDLWSAGCTLAELYMGRVLFGGQTPSEVLNKIVSVLGCLPIVYSEGKYASEYINLIGEPNSLADIKLSLQQFLQCEDMSFINLLAILLTYSKETRLTALEAFQNEFLTTALA